MKMNRNKGEVTMENKKIKWWKKILIIILILLLIFIINIFKKTIILNNIDNKVSNLENSSNNIYAEINSEDYKLKKYIKNDVEKLVVERTNENGEFSKIIQCTYPDQRKVYTEKEGIKVMNIYNEVASVRSAHVENSDVTSSYTSIINFAYHSNIFEKIVDSIITNIKSIEIDGKKCYELTSKYNSNFIYSENTKKMKAYVEQDSGLPIKLIEIINKNGENIEKVITYKYQFNIVTDEDIMEPNSQEYKIQEQN